MIKRLPFIVVCLLIVLYWPASAVASVNYNPLTREEFERWVDQPEYTVLNYFPNKGHNCTWYAHGRMMQLGYCKYALDTMRFNANTWADRADRGAVVSDLPAPGSIASWGSGEYFGSALGHVAVVEIVYDDGSILISESSSSAAAYNLRRIYPGNTIWPSAFIEVPRGQEKSRRFAVDELVRTTVNNLYFRLEGVNQQPILMPKDTILAVREHFANGIYSSQPGSITSYHYWWYATLVVEGELKHGWVAETYLNSVGFGELPQPTLPSPGQGLESDSDPPAEEDPPAVIPGSESKPGKSDSSPETELAPETKPELEYQLGDLLGNGLIDIRDVTLVLQHVLKIKELEFEMLPPADVNEDGLIDVRDAALMMRYILGFIDSFQSRAAVD